MFRRNSATLRAAELAWRWTRDGELLQQYVGTLREEGLSGAWTLAPGRYEIVCTDATGRQARTAFPVTAAGGEGAPPIVLDLP